MAENADPGGEPKPTLAPLTSSSLQLKEAHHI